MNKSMMHNGFVEKSFKVESFTKHLHLVAWCVRRIFNCAIRLYYVNLCINHELVDVEKRIIGMTMYQHGCERVHIVFT
jgi:hypothetical protein